tara:strand:+ start:119 stop:652 length:534 start_codon:yes stop_codon:yes gene_type:complete
MLFDSITNKITEHFSAQDDEVHKYNLRVIGLTFLVWGCLLYLIDSTPVGSVFYRLPGLKNVFTEANGSLDLSIGGEGKLSKLPSILSVLIIFIGLVLVLHAHAGLKAQGTMIACPILYTLAFLFLIATFQQPKGRTKTVCVVIFCICLLTGIVIQATNRDTFDEVVENQNQPTTTAQ